jgi:hypothetical protein
LELKLDSNSGWEKVLEKKYLKDFVLVLQWDQSLKVWEWELH